MAYDSLPQLKEDKTKIQEAILFVMSLADNLSQYDVVKTLFLADRSHLNKYGRPITFDNYVAMVHGPVPSLAYDALKPTYNYEAAFGRKRPWLATPDPSQAHVNRFTRTREPDLLYLSVSDRDALRAALSTVRSLTFGQLRRLTHEDPAYLEAWDSQRRGEKKREHMKLPLLIEKNGEELADRLVYISEHS